MTVTQIYINYNRAIRCIAAFGHYAKTDVLKTERNGKFIYYMNNQPSGGIPYGSKSKLRKIF